MYYILLYYIILFYIIYIIYINLVIATCEIICEDFGNKQHLSQSQLDFLRIDEDFNMAHTHIFIYIYVYQLYYISIFDIYSIYIYKQCTELHTYHLSGHKNSGSKSVRITHWTGVRVNQQKYPPPVIHNIASIHDT